MTRLPLAVAALLALAACDSFEEVEGEVLPDNLAVEAVDLARSGGGAVTVTATVRNVGAVDFSEATLAFTVEGDGQSRLFGGFVRGGLAVGARAVVTGTAADVPFEVACYRYAVSVAASTADQTVGDSEEYPGTCG